MCSEKKKNDSNTLGVDAHLYVCFFLKHGDKFLCFQKYPDTCGLDLKPAFTLHKNAFYVWTEGRNVEKNLRFQNIISGYVWIKPPK